MISPLDDCATSTDRVASIPADVVAVGRGINGVGIAFNAVARGHGTVLVERDDLDVGTSSQGSAQTEHGVPGTVERSKVKA